MTSSLVYLFIAHGSRESAAQQGFEALLKSLTRPLAPHAVCGAYLTLNEPSIEQAVEGWVKKGQSDFVIVPLFFFEGAHLKNDIPQILADLKLKYADVHFHVMPALASIEGFAGWVAENLAQTKGKH